jgi:hypothetical protein
MPRPLPTEPPPAHGRPLLARLQQGAAAARERVAAAIRSAAGEYSDDDAGAAESDAAPLLNAGNNAASSVGATLDAMFERLDRGRRSGDAGGGSNNV